MRKKEQLLWDNMRKRTPKDFELERVENLVGDGIPDVHFMCPGHFGWVELKSVTMPKRATTRYLGDEGLRQSQMNWHKVASFFGLPAYTLINDDKRNLLLVHCKRSDNLNEMTFEQVKAVSLACCWGDVWSVLRRGGKECHL